MHSVVKARRELIRLTAERALRDNITVADRGQMCDLLGKIADERGGNVLAYWRMAKESPQQFDNLRSAILKAVTKLEDQQREADRASARRMAEANLAPMKPEDLREGQAVWWFWHARQRVAVGKWVPAVVVKIHLSTVTIRLNRFEGDTKTVRAAPRYLKTEL